MNNKYPPLPTTVAGLKSAGFVGTDVSLSESLFVYGMIWKEEQDDYFFIYSNGRRKFYHGRFKKGLDLKKEFSWIKDWDGFFVTMGTDEKGFFSQSIPQCIFDLTLYYGFENIFGTSYWEGLTITEE